MSCPNLKSYSDVRKEKLEKINQYHKGSENSLLVKYQTFTGITDNDTTMKQNYKKQMDNLNKEMMNLLNSDVSLLIEQHNELEAKTHEVDTNDEALKAIKKKIESETVTSDARLKNNFDMINLEKNHKFYHNLYFYLNVLVLVCVIGLLIYMYLKY
jgi:hydroxypyruvate isomerase